MISIVLSFYNEGNNPYLLKIINQFREKPGFELLIVDGGSVDNTHKVLHENGLRFQVLENSTRGERLQEGSKNASHEALLLHHPRSLIDEAGLDYISKNHQHLSWAGFTHQFDHKHPFLKFISWYSNNVRLKKKKIVYLDHCIFFNRALLRGKELPSLAIFEDTALSELLNKQAEPKLLPYVSMTSSIRFLERGIYRQFLMNQCLKLAYSWGMDHQKMNRLYEKALNLNQKN